MADIPIPALPEPPATVATTTVTTSTNGARARTSAVAVSLVSCVVIEGIIAMACIWKPPAELGWNMVLEVIKGLAGLSLLLAGGLLGATKPVA
jgi:hypothetical protein